MFYIFISNPLYDIYYSGFILFQTIHWIILKNECIISYIEKKMIDPNYVLGKNPKWLPHYDVFYNDYTKIMKASFILGSLAFISLRNKLNIKIICIFSIILWVFLTYLQKNI